MLELGILSFGERRFVCLKGFFAIQPVVLTFFGVFTKPWTTIGGGEKTRERKLPYFYRVTNPVLSALITGLTDLNNLDIYFLKHTLFRAYIRILWHNDRVEDVCEKTNRVLCVCYFEQRENVTSRLGLLSDFFLNNSYQAVHKYLAQQAST